MVSENYGHPRSISSNRPDDYAKFQGHLALLHHETITPATVGEINITTNLFQHYRTEVNGSPLGRKLERFSYMRGKFRVRVAVQGSSVLAGKIVLAFTPWVTNRGGYGPNVDFGFYPTVVNSMVVPHLIIDPSKTESQELVLDCPTPTGVWTMQSPDDYGSYRVDMFFVSPLFSGTATVPDVSVCIYGGLEEASLEGITLLSSEPFVEEDKVARPSDIMTSLGDLSGVVGSVFPALSPYTSIFSSITGGAGRVLRAFGFSRPPRLDVDIPVLTRVHDPPMHSDGPSAAVVLGASQSQTLGIAPSLGGGEGQEMSFEWICKIPGLVAQYSIPTTSASGAAIVHGFAVHPAACYDVGGSKCPTPLAGVALPFEFWTGDILVHLEIVASVFHRATLLVAWDSNCAAGSSTPTMEVAQQTLPNTVITVSGNTAVTMRIPWNQQTPWLYVRGTSNGATRTPRSANGFLHVYVVNPVTSNGSTSPLPLNVYLSSDNIRFAAPEPSYIPALTSNLAMRPSESNGVIEPLSGPVLIVEDTAVSFGPKSDLSFVGLRAFGETPMSVKVLCQKMVPYVSTVVTALSSEENNYIAMRIPNNLPSGTANAVIFGNVPAAGTPGLTSAVPRRTWLGYFSSAYVGVRGSLRRGFTLDSRGGSVNAGSIHWATHDPWASNTPGSSFIVGATIPPAAVGSNLNRYSVVASNRQIAPMLEVVVPSMIANDFFCCGDVHVSETSGRVEHIFQVPGAGVSAANEVSWTTWVAAGDDLSFVRFVGFPAIENLSKPGPLGP